MDTTSDVTKPTTVTAITDGIVAAGVAGLGSAVICRILMRLVTLTVGGEPSFTVFGSFGIAVIFIVALLPGCVALALTPRRWPWILFAAGAVLLLFEAVAIGSQEASAHTLSAGQWVGLVLLLVAFAAVFTAQLYLAARLARRRQRPAHG